MNDFTNEGRESEASHVVTEAVALDILESRICQVLALVFLAMLLTSHATKLPPVVLLELLAQAAFDHPVEAGASFMGVLGTLLLATRTRWAGFGFVAFLASNAGWLWFSREHGHLWMFWQQVAFSISSLVGVWVWLVRKPRGRSVTVGVDFASGPDMSVMAIRDVEGLHVAVRRDCGAPTTCRWPRCSCAPLKSARGVAP